jgi:DNA-binding NarL/FixJ family response regulator
LQGFLLTHFPDIKIKLFPVGETCLMKMHLNPDVVIMDYFLNSKYGEAQNGLEIIKRIKKQNPQTNIVVLSAQDNYTVVLDAIKQYGCFYVQKDETAFDKVQQLIKNFDYKNNTVLETKV